MRGMKIKNGYVEELEDLYEKTPKAVFAAIAISALTTGGDYLEHAKERILEEWVALYENGIVSQKPPVTAYRGSRAQVG